jgi:PIN domain nuclease of toxin-antitoxin system
VLSVVSIREIAIKARLGRTSLAVRPEAIASSAIATGFAELPLHWQAAAAVANLPMRHSDPFYRAIVAQAMIASSSLIRHWSEPYDESGCNRW